MWCPTRNQLFYVALTIFSCVQVALTSNCYAVSPNVFRLGSKETVAIFVEGHQQQVEVFLANYPNQRETFCRQKRLVTPEQPVIINVNVDAVNLPEIDHGTNSVYVMIVVKCGTLWTQETPVLVTPTSASHVFLQTDKPIYHPGTKGHIRVLAVDETLKPPRMPFQLEVLNPQGAIMEKHSFFLGGQIMLTHSITLPEHTFLGEWTLVAKYGYKFQENTTATFAVEEYVLPRFSVELKTVDYILPNFKSISCRVKATFLNKEPVQGIVTFHFSVKTEVAEYLINRSREATLLAEGEADYVLERSVFQVKLGNDFERLFQGNSRLVVEATVTEDATSAKQTARNEKAYFSTTPFIISTVNSQRSLKPGITNYVIAQVSYRNGDPAQDVNVQLSALNTVTSSTTDKRGIVIFSIETGTSDRNLHVKLSTNDGSLGRNQQAHTELFLKKYEALNNVSIAVERPDPKRTLKPGDTFEARTFTDPPKKFSSVYYVVISRGRVQHMEKLIQGQLLKRAIGFTVTPEMTPSFRLVVFARVDGHVVSDSIYVNTVPTCSEASIFQIRRESPGLNAKPGALENLIITGKQGTHVEILGVDQALYFLHRKDLLTREKLFQELDTKDLGCGAGDGTDSAETLSNSGVVLLAGTRDGIPMRTDLSCQGRHRSKREVLFESPDRRSAPFEFEFEKHLINDIVHIEEVPRTDFGETWAFTQVTIGDNGNVTFGATLPHSVTTWEVNAVSVAPTGGICVADPLEIVASKSVFVEVNLPYSVIKNEQIEVPATVYNYGKYNTRVKVALLGTKDICSEARVGGISDVKAAFVKAGRGVTVTFPVTPLEVGVKHIHVRAVGTGDEGDLVIAPLRVEPTGVPMSTALNVVLDPSYQKKSEKRQLTHEDYVSKSSDSTFGTVVKNPMTLIKLPNGSGEQTMAKLAPTLYAYQYIKTTHQINDISEEIAIGHIRTGYTKMLTLRNKDGSFSVYTGKPASLWLTMFVIRNLCEAGKFMNINETVIVSGLNYMMNRLQRGGASHDNLELLGWNPLGREIDNLLLAAYVLLTLQECSQGAIQVHNLKLSRARETAFIEDNLLATSPAHTLAIASYALSLSDSPKKGTILKWLENIVRYDQDDNTRYVPYGTPAQTIQTTSYALMAFVNEKRDRRYLDSFVTWLNKQMQPSGYLNSTQDTVVALQALTKYVTFAKALEVDRPHEVTLNNDRVFNKTVGIKGDTTNVLKNMAIPNQAEKIFVSAKGVRTARPYFRHNYNQDVTHDDFCKINITVNFEEKKLDDSGIFARVKQRTNSKPRRGRTHERIYTMKPCVRSLTGSATGMAILDVGLLTGFKPVMDDLSKALTERRVDYYVVTSRSVIFYLTSIREDTDTCIEFGLTQVFVVGQIQSSYVKAYVYYDPDVSCTEFYSADKSNPLLELHCDDTEVCYCARGGCPDTNLLHGIIGDSSSPSIIKENMRKFACDEVDYVWLGFARTSFPHDGFNYAEFEITTVLKPGREDVELLENNVRLVKARDRCKSFNMTKGEQYIIMGKESTYNEEMEGDPPQPVYLIDTGGFVIPKKQFGVKRRLVNWFINEFRDEDRRCYA